MNQKIVKCFNFDKQNYARLTFSDSDKIRCNLQLFQLQLKSQGVNAVTGAPTYPTDVDLTVTTWVTNPTTVKQWIGFAVNCVQPTNTEIKFKLNDGTDDLYWTGSAWSVAGASNWNTEAEVVANIDTFPVIDQKLGFVINLVTTDSTVTPTIQSLDVLMQCEIDYMRSLIADSLIPSLREGLQFTVDTAKNAPGGMVLSLRNLETSYNIVGVAEVYNTTNDPNKLTNIFQSYSPLSKTITVSSGFNRGENAWIRFIVEPEVYLSWGSQDYTEVQKLPAVIIDAVTPAGSEVRAQAWVNNNTDLDAVVNRDPLRLDIDITITLMATKNRTLLAMMDKAMEHALETQLLNWNAVDENVDLQLMNEGFFKPRPNLGDSHASEYTLKLLNVYFWLHPSEVLPLVQNINVNLTKA